MPAFNVERAIGILVFGSIPTRRPRNWPGVVLKKKGEWRIRVQTKLPARPDQLPAGEPPAVTQAILAPPKGTAPPRTKPGSTVELGVTGAP